MAKFKIDKVLANEKGEPIPKDGNDKTPLTMQDILYQCLSASLKDDPELPSNERMNLFKLTIAVSNNEVVEFSVEDQNMVLERIQKTHSTLVYGRMSEFFEDESNRVKASK